MLTEAELRVLKKFTDAYCAYLELPECHPEELRELTHHFHIVQEKIMARAAVRAHPDTFTRVEGFG